MLESPVAAAQKYRLDVESVFFEQPLVFCDPDVALAKAERRIANLTFFNSCAPAALAQTVTMRRIRGQRSCEQFLEHDRSLPLGTFARNGP